MYLFMHNTRGTSMSHLRQFARLAILALVAVLPSHAKDLAVVVNKANDTKAISANDLAKLLKTNTKKWSNGQDVIVVMRDPTAPAMRIVVQKVFGIPADQVKALATAANQGRSTPSFVFADSDDMVLKLVAASAGAIGLTDVYAINSSVNVVKVDGKMPLEPGYLLHGVW
jgi:hypothetical protein